jgi:hypothetical protein
MNNFQLRVFTLVLSVALTGLVMGQEDTTMTITGEGDVGIGTTNPAEKLHVVGSLQLDKVGPDLGRLILHTASQNDPGRYGILFSNNQIAPFLGADIGEQNFSFYSTWGHTRDYDAVVEIHGKATAKWGNVLRLTHDGTDGKITTDTGDLILNPEDGGANVGIGTLQPIDKLEVEGGAFTLDGAGQLGAFRIRQNDSLRWTFLTAPWIDNDLRLRNEVTGWDVLVFDRATNNVGILTNNPMGTLDVNGTIYQRGSQLHADYVFEEEYQLESIDEHAAFMWKNRHLKGIPKARVDENGREIVEVGAHRKGIVEELEKAHIYIDQLHNRIEALEEKLQQLAENK